MSVFFQELKKNIFKRKILILLTIIIVFKAIYGMWIKEEPKNVNMYIEDYKEDYFVYLNNIDGKINKNKEEYINKAVEEYYNADEKIGIAGEKNYSGEISDKEYREICNELSEITSKSKVIEVLTSQVNYVKQDQDRRWFIYQNGWEDFFSEFGLDLILVFLLIFSCTSIFCNEYDTDMYRLNRTTYKGNNYLFYIKVLLGMTIAILFSTILFLENALISHIKYGLSNSYYPIQSICSFNECKWNISIIEMVEISYILVIIGATYLTALLIMLSVILKKSINVILILISILFIPQYIFNESIIYKYPFPIGFLNIKGYIYGIYNQDTGEYELLNKEVLVKIICLAIILTIVSLCIANIFYLKKNKKKFIKNLSILLISMFLCGCNKTKTEENIVYNASLFNLFTVSKDYVVNACKTPYTITNNNSNEILIKDPFLCDDEYDNITINGIFDGKVFYTKYKSNMDYEIYTVDIDDFSSERVFYQFESSIDGIDYLDINRDVPKGKYQTEQIHNNSCVGCWVDNEKMYIAKECGIYEYDKICNKFSSFNEGEQIINNAYDVFISYTEDKIFYINNNYKLEIYSVNEKRSEVLDDYMVSKCFAVNDRVYFSTLDGNIMCYNCNNGSVNKIYKSNNQLMNVDEKYIYCSNKEKGFDKVLIDSGNVEKTYSFDNDIMEIRSSSDGSKIYVALINDEVINYEIIQ